MQKDSSAGWGSSIGALRRRRRIIAMLALPVLLLTLALVLGLPDVYQSGARFRLVEDKSSAALTDRATVADQYVMGLEDRVLRSPDFRTIVTELKPYPKLLDAPDDAIARLRKDVTVDMVTESIADPEHARTKDVFTGFILAYENQSAEKAYVVTDRLADLFTKVGRATDLDRINREVQFFNNEADQTRKRIAEQEKQLAEFKEKNFNQLPEVAQANMNLREQVQRQLDDAERELRGLRQNRVFVANQLRQEQSGTGAGTLRQLEDEYQRKSAVYASDHPDMIALRRQIDNLKRSGGAVTGSSLQAELDSQRAALAEAQQRYSDDHPDVKRMKRDIAALEARIASGESAVASRTAPTVVGVQLQTQLNALDTQITSLETQVAQLRNQQIGIEMKLGATAEVERNFQALTRDLDSSRQVYNELINKRMNSELEAASVASGASDRFRILDSPRLPKEAKPGRIRTLVLGIMLSIFVGLGGAAAAELLDPTVRGVRDVHGVLQVTPLAIVPEIHNSAYHREHARRLKLLAVSVAISAPLLYLIVKVLAG